MCRCYCPFGELSIRRYSSLFGFTVYLFACYCIPLSSLLHSLSLCRRAFQIVPHDVPGPARSFVPAVPCLAMGQAGPARKSPEQLPRLVVRSGPIGERRRRLFPIAPGSGGGPTKLPGHFHSVSCFHPKTSFHGRRKLP